MPEWSKGADLRSAVFALAGSNPAVVILNFFFDDVHRACLLPPDLEDLFVLKVIYELVEDLILTAL